MFVLRTFWIVLLAALAALALPENAHASAKPAHLPRYHLDIDLDLARHVARVRMEATWINPQATPTDRLVFVAHSRYVVPGDQIGFTAKMLEILRMTPSDAMGVKEPQLVIDRIVHQGKDLSFSYEGETKTDLVVPMPAPIQGGESVTVVLEMTMKLPQKQGRWGQWEGVTFLANWLPVFAVYAPPDKRGVGQAFQPDTAARSPGVPPVASVTGETPGLRSQAGKPDLLGQPCTWQPPPFISWHQPFFNEAGNYTAKVRLPAGQRVACTGTIKSTKCLEGGWQVVEIEANAVRDFAFLCSSRYKMFEGTANAGPGGGGVRVHVLAFEEHEFYAKEMIRIAIEALETYSKWFGPYPWADFTIAESFFGWNGNECSTLVMIDQRVFAMPRAGVNYVDYLVSHEICHQWWYNLVGTNGYRETWMDEGLATHFSYRLLNQKLGRNFTLLQYPRGLSWLPNIHTQDYRSSGMFATYGKGEQSPVVQEMTGFGHMANLFNMVYDKGGRIVGTIEERLGEAAMLDFSRIVVKKYSHRILRVEDFRRELETYTGRSWETFFDQWLYGTGLLDWSVEKVTIHKPPKPNCSYTLPCLLRRRLLLCRGARPEDEDDIPPGCKKATVIVHQRGEIEEPTVLGFALPNCEGYPIRVPIVPGAEAYSIEQPRARITPLEKGKKGGTRIQVEIILPCEPSQVAIDPDQVLVDREPDNNFWHTPIRWRLTPLYTFLEETDLTNAYDRWNLLFGPWLFSPASKDSWFTRSPMFGMRAGAYRTQQFSGGAYTGYRTDWRDIVTGVDGTWEHWPGGKWQTGFIVERRLTEFNQGGDQDALRGVLWTRHIFTYGSCLYLPPIHFLEGFASYTDNFLPFPTQPSPTGVRYDQTTTLGLHYRLNYLTPYWDPEGGFSFDAWYEGGMARLPSMVGLNKLAAQFSLVKTPPDLSHHLEEGTFLRHALTWFSDWRFAFRLYGATAAPSRGEFFTMGGPDLYRGFDMAQRQGSSVWVGSVETRIPLAQRLNVDAVDHVFGLRNVYLAGFYDVGDAYTSGKQVGPVAHGVGGGLRFDVSWLSFVERTTLRLDVAKTVNADTGFQVWIGVNQPF